MQIACTIIHPVTITYWLVVYLTLWKIWVRQLGLLFPTEWKNNPLRFFPHIQGFKSNQGSHVILVALICSINIEPFRKNRESKKLNLALGLRVTSNSATLKFTREEPPSGLLTLRMPEPTVDPTNYWNQSRPMILRQNIPEFYQVRFAMDPTLSKYFLRWILLCPTLVCDGTYPNPSQNDAKCQI